jgi:hypothetical protein
MMGCSTPAPPAEQPPVVSSDLTVQQLAPGVYHVMARGDETEDEAAVRARLDQRITQLCNGDPFTVSYLSGIQSTGRRDAGSAVMRVPKNYVIEAETSCKQPG